MSHYNYQNLNSSTEHALNIQGISSTSKGYQSGVFTRCGTSKNYTLVEPPNSKQKEQYGAFSISAAVRPSHNITLNNFGGCNC